MLISRSVMTDTMSLPKRVPRTIHTSSPPTVTDATMSGPTIGPTQAKDVNENVTAANTVGSPAQIYNALRNNAEFKLRRFHNVVFKPTSYA